jgi:hypothetical protein
MNGTRRVVVAREEITTRCALCRHDIVARSDSAQLEESSEFRNDDNQVSVGIAVDAAGNRHHLHG